MSSSLYMDNILMEMEGLAKNIEIMTYRLSIYISDVDVRTEKLCKDMVSFNNKLNNIRQIVSKLNLS